MTHYRTKLCCLLSATTFLNFDAFFAKKPMTLNVKADKFYCETKRKAVIIFRFSPKDFGDGVWPKLEAVGLRAGVCDF